MADLLHDLKNQLVAARRANLDVADTRTARLEQQLTASRHLDQAQALAARLRSTTSLLGNFDPEAVEIGDFLRRYASSVLTRLPSCISLSVPYARQSSHVALDERSLTAVLDNLVGNSIEAIVDRGSITLDWAADDYEALIEIADDGPGLPSAVIEALHSGQRVRSAKLGGNGLGLLGVRSMLERIGAKLTSVPVESGTTWHITVPLFSEIDS